MIYSETIVQRRLTWYCFVVHVGHWPTYNKLPEKCFSYLMNYSIKLLPATLTKLAFFFSQKYINLPGAPICNICSGMCIYSKNT